MTTSKSHIEDMHARLQDVSAREKLLIRALDEALAAADRNLLDDVRSVAMEHEARRAVILTELQSLAARIGAFPISEPQIDHIEYDRLEEMQVPPTGGDWRKATERIADDEDYEIEQMMPAADTSAMSPGKAMAEKRRA